MHGAAIVITTLSGKGRFLIAAILACLLSSTVRSDDNWILVDSGNLTLSVMSGNIAKQIYKHVSLGRGGISPYKRQGDRITPLGEYRISRVSSESPFHVFFGLNYPNLDQAMKALQDGVISPGQFGAIRRALAQNQEPPQDTALGGYIGIHGVGAGSPEIHKNFNWTSGCVALTNEQIDDLAERIYIGMRVVIR